MTIKSWFVRAYKGIWSDDYLNDIKVMKAWVEHLEMSAPASSWRTHEDDKAREMRVAQIRLMNELK